MANQKKQAVQIPISNRAKVIAGFFGLILALIIIYFISQSGDSNSKSFGNSDTTPQISANENNVVNNNDFIKSTRTVTSATCKIVGVQNDLTGPGYTTLINLEASGTASGPVDPDSLYVLELEWLSVSSSSIIEEGLEYNCGSWSKVETGYLNVRCQRKEGQPETTTWSAKWTHYGLTNKDPVLRLRYDTDAIEKFSTVPCN